MPVDAPYLREVAQRCIVLARHCLHLPTSQALEVLSVELLERALEVEEETSLSRSPNDTSVCTKLGSVIQAEPTPKGKRSVGEMACAPFGVWPNTL